MLSTVTMPRRRSSHVKCPQAAPLVEFLNMVFGMHRLRYCDSISGRPRLPKGAVHLQLFVAITDQPNAPVEQARFRGTYTRGSFVVHFEPHENRKYATYYARWCSRRGETSNWSHPISFLVAA